MASDSSPPAQADDFDAAAGSMTAPVFGVTPTLAMMPPSGVNPLAADGMRGEGRGAGLIETRWVTLASDIQGGGRGVGTWVSGLWMGAKTAVDGISGEAGRGSCPPGLPASVTP